MEHLGWVGSPIGMNPSALWGNQQYEVQESFMHPPSSSCAHGSRMDPVEIFYPSQELLKTHISSERTREEAQILASDFDSRNAVSRSGSGIKLGEAMCYELGSSLMNKPTIAMNCPTEPMTSVGMLGQSQAVNRVTTTSSFESLDCLVSASNSNTDTSVEDDKFSVLFSDCSNMWNFGSSCNAASSEDSEDPEDHCSSLRNKKIQCTLNDHSNETVSLEAKKDFTKRSKNGQNDFKADMNYLLTEQLQSNSSATEGSFQLVSESPLKLKRPRSDMRRNSSSNINFQQCSSSVPSMEEPDSEAIAQMKEMMYRAAAFRPVNLGSEMVEKPKRKNVRISTDPQTVAARQRRERISERIRVLQRLVPGGSKMDTASMLDEAANYLKFLKSQVKALEGLGHSKLETTNCCPPTTSLPFPSVPFNHSFPMQTLFPLQNPNQIHHTSR